MKKTLKFSALLAASFWLSGCAGIVEIRLPPEFKGKKQVEDPPLSWIQPLQDREAAG